MFNDAQINARLRTMVNGIAAPPVPLQSILHKVPQRQAAPRTLPAYLRPALAAAAVVVIGGVALTPGFVQALDSLAALLGWIPPPAPPKTLLSKLQPETVTLATAQSQVSFSIVAPSGLPSDVVSSLIRSAPSGTYTKATHTWQKGPRYLNFSYRRSDGRSFFLTASRFDPKAAPPPKYMYEEKDDRDPSAPHAVLIKHEHFAWRNGDQVMSTTEDSGISAEEIAAIRLAMHGVPLARATTRKALNAGPTDKLFILPKP